MTTYTLEDLQAIMVLLRRECPWDQKQTPQSLTRYAIEEAYEVEQAVQSGDSAAVADELGDLLLQVVFQSVMYQEQHAFGFEQVVDGLCHKLIRRHPHVFGGQELETEAQVSAQWEAIKQQEKQGSGSIQTTSLLSAVKHGPAVMQAESLQKTVAKVGFDWPDIQGARAKLTEELSELDEAIGLQDAEAITDELGDAFFALINVARKLNVSPEMALLGTIRKFRRRFQTVETSLQASGRDWADSSLEELDRWWDEAKGLER